ncbi:MAG: DUF2807 domain-containing protein [Planctomycetaceae bacterium]|nr:DUF2807 domain-containing protein [Planctomycetaceae bacterium]
MNEKLRNHINILFAAAPKTAKTGEIKEELLTNLNDKYNDLLANGYDSTAAFHIALSGIGDIDELLGTCNGTAKPNGTEIAVILTRPAMSKATRIALYLGLAFGLPIIGLGVAIFAGAFGAPGFGILSTFFCWAASPVFLILAFVTLFSKGSRQAEEYYRRQVFLQAERHGLSKEFVQNEIRAINRTNKLHQAVFVLLIVFLSFVIVGIVGGVVGIARNVQQMPFAQWFDWGITPSGPIITEEREIGGDFALLNINSAMSVVFKQSDQNLIVIETHEDVMPFINTEVKNNSLTIYGLNHRLRNIKKLQATVYYQHVPDAFFVSGASSLTIPEPTTAESIAFDCSGASRVHVQHIESERLNLRISGASFVDISGKSDSVHIQASGASRLRASDFDSNYCDVDARGASRVDFGNIGRELSVRAAGGSNVRYGGTPMIMKQDVSGSSRVRKQ